MASIKTTLEDSIGALYMISMSVNENNDLEWNSPNWTEPCLVNVGYLTLIELIGDKELIDGRTYIRRNIDLTDKSTIAKINLINIYYNLLEEPNYEEQPRSEGTA